MQEMDILFSKDKKEIKRIYFDAFSGKERMPFEMMLFLSILPTTRFIVFYEGDRVFGFTYLGIQGNYIFIMFFAVDRELRNLGFGSKILSRLKSIYPNRTIVVTIEPAVGNSLDIQNRRKQFYLRNDFEETGLYINSFGNLQEILFYGREFKKKEFSFFLITYSLFVIWPRYTHKE